MQRSQSRIARTRGRPRRHHRVTTWHGCCPGSSGLLVRPRCRARALQSAAARRSWPPWTVTRVTWQINKAEVASPVTDDPWRVGDLQTPFSAYECSSQLYIPVFTHAQCTLVARPSRHALPYSAPISLIDLGQYRDRAAGPAYAPAFTRGGAHTYKCWRRAHCVRRSVP